MAKKKVKTFDELLEEEFGEAIFDEKKDDLDEEEAIVAIKTGSISLDVSTGVGGIPLRRFTEIYGPEGSGKTNLALSVCRSVLKDGDEVLYIDPEQGVDMSLVRGVIGEDFNKDNFLLIKPETMEDSLRIAEAGIQSKRFKLIILDSIGSMSPIKVKVDALTDDNVALLSRRMTIFVSRNLYDLRRSDVAFIGINQIRDVIGSYIKMFESPGGHAWKHAASLRILLSKAMDIEQDGEKIGIGTRFTIKKNKLARPFRTHFIPIIFGKGVDSVRDTVEFATMLGILIKAGGWYKFEGETLGIGMDKTLEFLNNNPIILDKINISCYNSIKDDSFLVDEDIEL